MSVRIKTKDGKWAGGLVKWGPEKGKFQPSRSLNVLKSSRFASENL